MTLCQWYNVLVVYTIIQITEGGGQKLKSGLLHVWHSMGEVAISLTGTTVIIIMTRIIDTLPL